MCSVAIVVVRIGVWYETRLVPSGSGPEILHILIIVRAAVNHGDADTGAIQAEYIRGKIRTHGFPAVIGVANIGGVASRSHSPIRRDELDIGIIG